MDYVENFRGGILAPFFALTLFAGVRPDYRDGEISKLEHFQKICGHFMKFISHATAQRPQRNPYGAAAPVALVASLREAMVLFKML